ncbi:hypothetical protein CTAYLR_003026 [Chrysophaeum taylorii]|uniref:Pyrroline-5-carboxylate reductase catalytic N-terminal domain-containing protein n=1 Tax=Chrysophaeum taylorii TaxID=2483200 RepID=A0AAD7U5U3_9STRA|nr:hypothetical protein CTAYLR_003026 [Chrysophaeum taylorii]
MSVAIIGSGQVGCAVATNLVKSSKFDVIFGSRDPKKTSEKIPQFTVTSTKDAIKSAVAVVLAVPGPPDEEGIKKIAADLGDCTGKVILDATNPLTPFPALAIRWGHEKSGGEILAQALPTAAVYKAFNTVGAEHIAHPEGAASGVSVQEDMLVAGDETPDKRDLAMAVVKAAGFRPHFVGPIRYARNLEAIAELWIHLSAGIIGESNEDWGRGFNFGIIGHINE